MPMAPEGYHWECVGYVAIPLAPPVPVSNVCSAALKASDGRRHQCAHRACFDLAERNARLWTTGLIGQARLAELSEDLQGYCATAYMYQQWLLQHPCLPVGTSGRDIRVKLKERRRALKEWLMQGAAAAASSRG